MLFLAIHWSFHSVLFLKKRSHFAHLRVSKTSPNNEHLNFETFVCNWYVATELSSTSGRPCVGNGALSVLFLQRAIIFTEDSNQSTVHAKTIWKNHGYSYFWRSAIFLQSLIINLAQVAICHLTSGSHNVDEF